MSGIWLYIQKLIECVVVNLVEAVNVFHVALLVVLLVVTQTKHLLHDVLLHVHISILRHDNTHRITL